MSHQGDPLSQEPCTGTGSNYESKHIASHLLPDELIILPQQSFGEIDYPWPSHFIVGSPKYWTFPFLLHYRADNNKKQS